MRNLFEIYELLSVPPRGILIESIQLNRLGTELTLKCFYDPDKMDPFTLTFNGCKNITWELMHEDEANSVHPNDVADVIGIHLGDDVYKESAVIHTDVFELIIFYNTKTILKDC